MKLLLVLGADDSYEIISKSIKPLGFELIRYRHVLKAMDNIDEINPDAIVISARDFPRHWKIIVQFVRSERPKETCPIIILKGKSFSDGETSEAFFLGVSGIVDDALDKPEELDRLQNILSCYVPINDKRKYRRFFVEHWKRVGFLMANVTGKSIITGNVITISANGLSFVPDKSMPTENIAVNSELRECSLRIGDAIISPVCRIVRVGKTLSMEFISFPNDEQRILNQYLEDFPLLETTMGRAS